MLNRYSQPEMVNIWSEESKYRTWFEIEAYACEAMAEFGHIPKQSSDTIWEKGSLPSFDIKRIQEIERETKHDVIAFLTYLAEIIGPDARYIHLGMTSSDVLDTCFNVQCAKAADLMLEGMEKLLNVLKIRAYEHKNTVTIGRSHGIHAEPTTFGLKLAQMYAEMQRNRCRLKAAKEEVATCAISGAVGTFANIDPRIEGYVAKCMNLTPEPISTQVTPRDRHAEYFTTLAIIASSIERVAIEIRHLQRTELLEVEEQFCSGQKGSSAMPHKRNPILSENLTGLARMIRSYCIPALENIALWHERDISHSSVERMIGPDATVTLDFAISRLTGVIENLVVYPEVMENNLNRLGGLINSQRILLALTNKGISREDSYVMVQRCALAALDNYQSNNGRKGNNEVKLDKIAHEFLNLLGDSRKSNESKDGSQEQNIEESSEFDSEVEKMRFDSTNGLELSMDNKKCRDNPNKLSNEHNRGILQNIKGLVKKYHTKNSNGIDFKEALLADNEVMKHLTEEEIHRNLDIDYHTKHVDTIFRRVFEN